MKPLKATSCLFLFLLPVFFVLHGYVEFYDIVLGEDILKLLGQYLVSALVIWIVFYFVFRNWQKAALYSFVLLCFHFFFGSLHDSAKALLDPSFLVKYSFILPFSFIILVAILLLIRKSTYNSNKLSLYLTLVLAVLIATDVVQLLSKADWTSKAPGQELPTSFSSCPTCPKPNIYFILADEYAGQEQLMNLLNFDNTGFENELSKRGFYIIQHSRSNYNSTPYAMASLLNMEYLQGIKGDDDLKEDLKLCYEKINRNKVAGFLQSAGYQISSYSVFNFANIPSNHRVRLFPTKDRIISSQTFLSRIQRDVLYHLLILFNIEVSFTNFIYDDLHYNNNTLQQTKAEARSTQEPPRFVYTHLIMPHGPHYFDKNGRPFSLQSLLTGPYGREKEYTSYLQYSNTRFLDLIDDILTRSKTPPIIVFMSDHGFRFYNPGLDPKFQFMNFNAVYLPDQNYAGFYNNMSNVNQFRVLLNTVFNQKLPLLKDSTIYIE